MTATISKRNFLKFAMGSGLALGSCASAVARVATDDMKWDKTTDVLVLGFGGAGAAAALEAKKKGADVLILEKMPQPGGNTAVSAGGFMCPDDEAKAYEYLKGTYTYSHAEMDEALLRTFCREVMDLKNFVTGLGENIKLFVYGYAGFKNLPGQEVIKRYRVRGQKGGPKKGAGDCLFDVLKGADVYVVKPRSMIVIGYFARPLMVNANNAFVYRDYALDSSKAGFKLEEAAGYKAAVRDTNCVCTYTPEERARYNFFDGRFPADSPKNLMNRMKDYKNTVVFGTATPAKGAAPTAEALKAVEAQYNNGGKLMTKAEVDKAVAAAEGVKKTYYWSDESKNAAMPDRFMVTYTGKDSNGKPFRVDLPNWNRWFALQPNNTCGLATRHTIEFR